MPWGIRDLAAGDGVHKATIYGSCERVASGDTIFGFDVTKTTAKPARSKGFRSALDWPSTGVDSSVLTIRALAYDSNANTMYVSDWDGLVTEIKPDGTKVREFKPRDISRFGMGYDPLRRSIIAVGQTGSSIGARVGLVAVEYDTATLLETGTMFFGDRSIPGHGSVTNNGGVSGGCDLRIERRSMPTATSGVTNDIDVPVLTWCSQAASSKRSSGCAA